MPFGEFLDVSLFYDDMHVKGPTVGRGKRMTENVLLSLQWRREMFSGEGRDEWAWPAVREGKEGEGANP